MYLVRICVSQISRAGLEENVHDLEREPGVEGSEKARKTRVLTGVNKLLSHLQTIHYCAERKRPLVPTNYVCPYIFSPVSTALSLSNTAVEAAHLHCHCFFSRAVQRLPCGLARCNCLHLQLWVQFSPGSFCHSA